MNNRHRYKNHYETIEYSPVSTSPVYHTVDVRIAVMIRSTGEVVEESKQGINKSINNSKPEVEKLYWHPGDTDVNDDIQNVDDVSGDVDSTERILITS